MQFWLWSNRTCINTNVDIDNIYSCKEKKNNIYIKLTKAKL